MRLRKKRSEVIKDADELFNWLMEQNEKYYAENPDAPVYVDPAKAQRKIREHLLKIAGEYFELYD